MSSSNSADGLVAVLSQLLPGLLVVGLLVLGLGCRKKFRSELQAPLLAYVGVLDAAAVRVCVCASESLGTHSREEDPLVFALLSSEVTVEHRVDAAMRCVDCPVEVHNNGPTTRESIH